MAAGAGRNWAIYIYNGASYVAVAGLRTRSFTIGNTNVDVTTADSAGRWRELLGNAGVQNLDMEGAGVYQNDAGAKLIAQAASTSTLQTMRLVANGIQIDGTFLVDQFKSDGAYNEGATFEAKFLSSGAVTFTYS
jgi:TP901-1 family phage major tail protein